MADDTTPDIPLHHRINWAEAGAYLADAALTLIEPRNLHGWKKLAYWGVASALTGVATSAVVRRESGFGWYAYAPLSDEDLSTPGMFTHVDGRTLAAVSGVTFGLKDPMLKADAWVADTLESWGIKRPRIAMAGLSLLTGAAAVALSARLSLPGDMFLEEGIEPREIDPRVRQVVAEILAKQDGWDADALRAQFAEASQLGDFDADGQVFFEVPEHLPRSAVDYYTFPVYGSGMVGDEEVRVILDVSDGYVHSLTVAAVHGDSKELSIPDDLTYEFGLPGYESDEEADLDARLS